MLCLRHQPASMSDASKLADLVVLQQASGNAGMGKRLGSHRRRAYIWHLLALLQRSFTLAEWWRFALLDWTGLGEVYYDHDPVTCTTHMLWSRSLNPGTTVQAGSDHTAGGAGSLPAHTCQQQSA